MSLESQPQIILATTSSQLSANFTTAEIPVTHQDQPYTSDLFDERKEPKQLAKDISLEKANYYSSTKQSIVIATHSLITLNNQILPTPQNQTQAKSQLSQISGKTIQIVTGVAIIDSPKSRIINQTHTLDVQIANLSKHEKAWYINQKEFTTHPPINIFKKGASLIKSINGTPTPYRFILEQLLNLGYEDFLMPLPQDEATPKENTGSHLPFL